MTEDRPENPDAPFVVPWYHWTWVAPLALLLRLWLAVPGARPLPEVFAQRYGSVTVGDRGGIVVPGMVPCVPAG